MTIKHVKSFAKVESHSSNVLNQFESTIISLRKDNESLAVLHASVDSDIERLQNLKISIVERITNNDNAIGGLGRVLNNA